ncbi:MAG: hypothetical protein ACKOC0_05580, partial [Cytophagales bacterium]
MLTNYITIAFRSFLKKPIFSLINVVGLSIGIAVFILILQFVSFEQSINKFHANLASIHRVMFEAKNGQVYEYSAPVIGQTA